MVYQLKLECSLEKQDCATLYPILPGNEKLPFTSQSCVRDKRLEGNVGRCGFPGATCSSSEGQDNCAGGSNLCNGSICTGGVGSSCKAAWDCNWGIQCNVTGTGGVCGGFGAYFNSDEISTGGLDVGKDYCLSGQFFANKDGYHQCQGGPTMAETYPPTHKVSKGLIGGVSAGVTILLVAIIALILWWKRRQAFILWWKRRQNRSGMSPIKTFDEHPSNTDEEKINVQSIPRPYIASERSSADPVADNPSFSSFMIVPSRTVFPPEIQSDHNGNL